MIVIIISNGKTNCHKKRELTSSVMKKTPCQQASKMDLSSK